MDNTQQVKRNTIIAYGGLATPLAMIGYPIAIIASGVANPP